MAVFFTGSQAFGEDKRAPRFYTPMSKLLAERYRLLYDVARSSFGIMQQKKVRDFDVDAFERDVEAIAVEQGWTR